MKETCRKGRMKHSKERISQVSEERIHSMKFSLNPAGDGRNSLHMSVAGWLCGGCVWQSAGAADNWSWKGAQEQLSLVFWNRGCFHCFQNPIRYSSHPQNTDIYSAIEFQNPTRLWQPWVLLYPLLLYSWASHTQDIFDNPQGLEGWRCKHVWVPCSLPHIKRQFHGPLQESNGSSRL